jgi:membrane protease YdiL (CAAX protease family)
VRIFTTASGRLRVGWRLLIYIGLLVLLYVAVASLLAPDLVGHGLSLLIASLGAGWVLLGMEGRPPAALGFPPHGGAPREVLLGLALGCAVGVAAAGLMAAAGALRWGVGSASPAAYLWAALTSLALLAPLAAAEEALVRGYPLQALSDAWGPGIALPLTSAGFGLLHAANPGVAWVGLLNTALAGLFLGALYLRTGSLWWPSGAHLGWNWAHAFLLDLPVSGLDVVDTPGLTSRASGPALLSGGAFGPEGSLLAALVLLAATAWVWSTRRLAPSPAAAAAPLLARLRVVEGNGSRSQSSRAE